MTKQYKSELSGVIHEMASALNEIGVMDNGTMKHFDKTYLTDTPFNSEAIRAIREQYHLSQADFAHQLNVSIRSLAAWENGTQKPSGAAVKLLTIVKNKGIEAIA